MLRINRLVFLLMLVSINLFFLNANCQTVTFDSVNVAYGKIIILNDTTIVPTRDTIIIIPSDLEYKIKDNPFDKTQSFYDSLAIKASKNKLKNEIYRNLVRKRSSTNNESSKMIRPEDKYLPFAGLTINNIEFYKVDILEGNVRDTSIKADDGVAKALNSSHKNTIDRVLKNNLLMQVGETIDPIMLADNERILRNLTFIEDALFMVVPIDSTRADLIVVTKDVFPIGGTFGYSNYKKFYIQVSNNNVLGTGQGLKYRALVNANYTPIVGHQVEYSKSNIGHSFANVLIKYKGTPGYKNYIAKVQSEFVTPETKNGYGLEFENLTDSILLAYPDSAVRFGFSRNSTTGWGGHRFSISQNMRQSMVTSLKYKLNSFENRPVTSTDSNQFFQNSQSVLGSLTFIESKNFTTRYLRGFGRTEDVNAGFLATGTLGYFWTDFYNLYYGALALGYGHVFQQGAFWACRIEYGTYYNEKPFLGVLSFKSRAYTKLIKINRSNFRLLAELRYSNGVNRYEYEWVNLGDDIKGMSSKEETRGKSKTAIGIEAILFTGSYFYGFQFAPYFVATAGLIRNDDPIPYSGTYYDGFGLGVRIRNESLVFQTFDVSFMVYPHRPDGGKSFTFIFDDREPKVFERIVIGEPDVVEY